MAHGRENPNYAGSERIKLLNRKKPTLHSTENNSKEFGVLLENNFAALNKDDDIDALNDHLTKVIIYSALLLGDEDPKDKSSKLCKKLRDSLKNSEIWYSIKSKQTDDFVKLSKINKIKTTENNMAKSEEAKRWGRFQNLQEKKQLNRMYALRTKKGAITWTIH